MPSLLFDLDGTLLDSAPGILSSLHSVTQQLISSSFSEDDLRPYIGSGLREIFPVLLDTNEPEIIEEAVRLFREHYLASGMYVAKPFPGIIDVLSKLKESGLYNMYIATAKYRSAAIEVAKAFKIDKYFNEVYGPEAGGLYDDKADLVEYIVGRHSIKAEDACMIGDRRHDILAAKRNNIRAVGVTYGYGTLPELKEAGALHICESTSDILKLVDTIF